MEKTYRHGASVQLTYIRIIRILNNRFYNKYFNYDSILGVLYYTYREDIKKDKLKDFMSELQLWGFVSLHKKGSRTPFKLMMLIPERMTYDIIDHSIGWWMTGKEKYDIIKSYQIMEREDKIKKLKERIK